MKIEITFRIILALIILACASCDNDDDDVPTTGTYILGLGVTTSMEITNFVIGAKSLASGVISLVGQGTLQEGYRDYAFGGDTFYSIGGLGVTDVNAITSKSDTLNIQPGLTFEFQVDDFKDVEGNGTTMLGISSPLSPSTSTNMQFYTVDIATNTRSNVTNIPFNSVYDTSRHWIFHTGMEVSGGKLYQTFYPVDAISFNTQNTDTLYVAIYSYPSFQLEEVITDVRVGPAGAFNTRSGIFKAENGDLYTVSTSSISNGYSQSTKPAGILRIPAGSNDFDENYFFNTQNAVSGPGGKIAHAIYIGDNKLFAAVTVADHTIEDRWSDTNLRLAIVDLIAQTITLVEGAPEFTGNGGRSFAALQEGNKVYYGLTDEDGLYIYETDIDAATAVRGTEVRATFVGGLARLK